MKTINIDDSILIKKQQEEIEILEAKVDELLAEVYDLNLIIKHQESGIRDMLKEIGDLQDAISCLNL